MNIIEPNIVILLERAHQVTVNGKPQKENRDEASKTDEVKEIENVLGLKVRRFWVKLFP